MILVLGTLLAGCDREFGSASGDAQVQALQAKEELERTKKRLGMAERKLAEKDDAVALAKEEAEHAAKQVAEKDRILADKDAQIAALGKQITDLQKGEAIVYAEIAKLHQQGMNSTALLHYHQFVTNFPTSPLVVDANRAIAELTAAAPAQAPARAPAVDPYAAERAFQRLFADGFASLDNVATMVKHKSMAEVVKLLGSPNRTYRDGTELGYEDKVIDPATGNRGTLVISFDADQVSSLRVGYQGRPIRP
jgi:hypothetical protein